MTEKPKTWRQFVMKRQLEKSVFLIDCLSLCSLDRLTRTDKHTARQTDIMTDRQTNKKTERRQEMQIDKHKVTCHLGVSK